jgi:hypothetical protein
MKRTVGFMVCFALLVTGAWLPGGVYAQEEETAPAADPRAAMAAAMAAEGIKMPGEVTTPMGTITLHGMITTGVLGYMTDNTAVDGDEEEWGLMPYDPIWTANQAQVSLTYDLWGF